MIKLVEGDLLQATQYIIAHQVNAQAQMNSGVAKQIREQYPHTYNMYMHVCKSTEDRYKLLGQVVMCQSRNTDSKFSYIAHIFGQYNYGYDGKLYTNYTALEGAFIHLNRVCKKYKKSLAMPFKLGCDRGGGDWNIVYGLMEDFLKDTEVTLYKL
jgi:O-acetyl-ADP-ribose deacetylase (regulator of RNase III)